MHDALIRQGLAHRFQRDGLAALGRVQRQRCRHEGGVQLDVEAAVHDLADGALDGLGGRAAQVDEGNDGVIVERIRTPALRGRGSDQHVPRRKVGVDRQGVGFVGNRNVGILVGGLGIGLGGGR